ncbi:hypothetical protein GVO57_07290 [Sphingomonas changnyeongensis]|uniref:Uncharacterized protein n=1 Tax=Sphingomonas changnyeongensis TaxID=2698679 RepID=A0A7Z2NWE3_9SPHN|nr:hypothetical protein [Sphingomonas changnyeongensis]QHL90671.1 hypothetical protein GVO57_07290 [Sphingomonas changnyeongensis]
MGKLTAGSTDLAAQVDEGALTSAATVGDAVRVIGRTNVTISGGFVGTLRLERSFDAGVTWVPVTVGGVPVDFTGPMSEEVDELESGMLYRFRATSLTSGAANWRISR